MAKENDIWHSNYGVINDGEVPGCSTWTVLNGPKGSINTILTSAEVNEVLASSVDEDDLIGEDERYQEEVKKLQNQVHLSEVDLQDEYFDADDLCIDEDQKMDGLSDNEVGLSDDELEDYNKKYRRKTVDLERCPHPAPKKGRGRRSQKRKVDDLTAQNEALNIVNILKHRKSFKMDCLNGVEVGPKIDKRLLPLIKFEKDTLGPQDEITKKLKYLMGCLEPLSKRLYSAHLRWLFEKSDEKRVIADYLLPTIMSWFDSFRTKYLDQFPILQDGSDQAAIMLRLQMKNTGSRALHELMTISCGNREARRQVDDMIRFCGRIVKMKISLADKFEKQYNQGAGINAKLDETSIWGMKPLRLALDRPYLKSEDGMLAAPLTPEGILKETVYADCFFRRDKQKWTTKDVVALKQCVRETLIETKLHGVRGRYQDLVQDCRKQKQRDELEAGGGTLPAVPAKRKRGRPKKADVLREEQFGKIFPVLFSRPDGMVVRTTVTPKILGEWRTQEEKRVKSLNYETVLAESQGHVDWDSVSQKMIIKTRKNRTSEDCALAWKHEADPVVKTKRWTIQETKQLKELYGKLGDNRWDEIAEQFNNISIAKNNPMRTAYQCYFRFRNRVEPPKKMVWNAEKDALAKEWIAKTNGNWRVVAEQLDDPAATKRQIIERYKKNINPVLRNGAFTRVEDCLLLLTIEKLKPFLAREAHFGSLLAYLPWRFETTWRDRANNLFSDWIVPWTLEEDQKLIDLAVEMDRNWQKISEEFTSFKNRKGCLTRYKILQRRLKDGRYHSLEEYHEAYALTRYNVFQYKHLKEIAALLDKVNNTVLPKCFQKFPGLERDTPPPECRLQHMLMTFDKDIVRSTIISLQKYIASRDTYWKGWISRHGKRKRTFDRRTFHGESARSIASAIHIRDLQLKPKREIVNISDFEQEIYTFYAQFCRTKAIKRTTERRYIPSARKLASWSAIERLISTPLDSLPPDVNPRKFKMKAKSEGNDSDDDNWLVSKKKRGSKKLGKKSATPGSGKRRGRPPKNLDLEIDATVGEKPARPIVAKRGKPKKQLVHDDSAESDD